MADGGMYQEKEPYIERAESVLYRIYNRYPVVFDHGKGVYLYDTKGKEYLDFGAGIAVMGLGYGDEEYGRAVKKQVDQLLHTSNLFYNRPSIEAAGKLAEASGMERVFFTNSGTEAIEGALKLARKHGISRGITGTPEIVAMEHSFHGRSLGALSVTGNPGYQKPFGPLLPGIRFARFNDLDSVREQMGEKTCAIILETVQGEGGIYPASEEFLKGVRSLCDQKGCLLILDEIQCGMGRTGTMFAWQRYGVKPDVMAVAKALGNGLPIGAFLAAGEAAFTLKPGEHGTTYGGNPLVTAAACAVLDRYKERKIVDHVKELGGYLWEKLEEFSKRFSCITDHRGAGLLQGLEFSRPVAAMISSALLEQGLVLIGAGSRVIRFIPPLIIEKEHVDEMGKRLETVILQSGG